MFIGDQQISRVVALFAHPDDAELIAYGTLRRLASSGADVTILIATNGEQGRRVGETGHGDLAAIRRKETCDALSNITSNVQFLDLEDGCLSIDGHTISIIETEINKLSPELVITHYVGVDGIDHHDHIIVGRIAMNICFRKRFVKCLLAGEPIHPMTEFRPNLFVDIDDLFDEKCAALAKHASQLGRTYLTRDFHLTRSHAWTGLSHSDARFENFKLLKAVC